MLLAASHRVTMKLVLLPFLAVFLGINSAVAQMALLPEVLQAKVIAPQPEVDSWVLMEQDTGWVLDEKNLRIHAAPASLTKLMTTYLTFEALVQGRLKTSDQVLISKKAWQSPGSRMFAKVDTRVSVNDLLKGLVIQSGNDAAVALAEYLGGSEIGFAAMMNQKAAELGLLDSHFVNASGLPDPEHYTSAFDVALLSRALIRDFSSLYRLFAVPSFTYNDIKQDNRNGLLALGSGYDGLKTGHTEAAGYCLAGSAERNGARFIAVVLGASSSRKRVQMTQSLIEYAFANYDVVEVLKPGQAAKQVPLYKGEGNLVELVKDGALRVPVPRGSSAGLALDFQTESALEAPLQAGQVVGAASLLFNAQPIMQFELLTKQDYPQGPLWKRLFDSAKMWIFN